MRHAESDHNVQNCCAGYYNRSSPTEAGIEKIRQGGKLLLEMGVILDSIYVSPLHRAVMSAHALLDELSLTDMIIVEALAERNFGAFTGMSKMQIKEALSPASFHQYIHDKNFFPPNIEWGHKYFQSEDLYGVWPHNHQGESYQCVINRLSPFLQQMKKELLSGRNVLTMGHSHTLQILQMLLYASEFEQGIESYKIDHATPIKFTFSCSADNQLIIEERINLVDQSDMRCRF